MWLAENHTQPTGIWLRIFKKGSNALTVTYAEALDEALCYGWIDGQKNKYDEHSWLQKFTPRRKKSINLRHRRARADVFFERLRRTGFSATTDARRVFLRLHRRSARLANRVFDNFARPFEISLADATRHSGKSRVGRSRFDFLFLVRFFENNFSLARRTSAGIF